MRPSRASDAHRHVLQERFSTSAVSKEELRGVVEPRRREVVHVVKIALQILSGGVERMQALSDGRAAQDGTCSPSKALGTSHRAWGTC